MQLESEKSESIVEDLMPKQTFERRFAFIDNETLKRNIAIAFEYIVFLIAVAGEEKHKRLIRSSIYKDILVYTGTIIEACLAHVLEKYIAAGKLSKSKVLVPKWKEEASGVIHNFNKKRRIRYVTEHLIHEDMTDTTHFVEINRACLRGKILTQKEYEIAEEIRTRRNKLHMYALKNIDNSYSKEDLDEFFEKATVIIDKVEKKLNKLSK